MRRMIRQDTPDAVGETCPPNEKALAILAAISERRRNQPLTGPGRSMIDLREARSGGMHGYGESAQPDE